MAMNSFQFVENVSTQDFLREKVRRLLGEANNLTTTANEKRDEAAELDKDAKAKTEQAETFQRDIDRLNGLNK